MRGGAGFDPGVGGHGLLGLGHLGTCPCSKYALCLGREIPDIPNGGSVTAANGEWT